MTALALRPQCYLPCKMKTEPDINTASPANFRTTFLPQANWQNRDKNKQTNKKPAIMFSFPKKSGERKKEDWKHDTSCWPFCFRNLLRKWSLLKIALTKREWNKKPVSAKPCTPLNMYTSNLVSRVEFPCIKILELTSCTRSYFSSDMVFVSLQVG